MQVGSSIQAHNAPGGYENSLEVENSGEIIHANSEDNSVWVKSSKKAKPGLFARLMDSLTGKTKKAAVGSMGNDFQGNLINNAEEQAASAFSGLSSEKSNRLLSLAKKEASGLLARGERINAESENTVFLDAKEDTCFLFEGFVVENFAPQALPQTDALSEENLLTAQSDTRNLGSSNLGSEQQLAGDSPSIAYTNVETDAIQQELSNVEEAKGENALSRQNESRAAVDFLGPRNQENRFAEFTGEPKLGLVDTMGLERGAESGTRRPDNRRRTERPVVEVRDLRTGETRTNTTETGHSTSSVNFRTERIDVDIPVDLSVNSGRAIGDKAQDAPSLTARGFEDALARELRENLNTDIVRQASVILRNGGEGIIKLSLRPETLGNVKIRLEMTENKITGHIIVESSEAFRAFERELPVLEKSFQDSGFSETNLDMFLAQDNGNYNSQRQEGEFPQLSPELVVSRYESEADIREIPGGVTSDMADRTSVNLLI